MTVDSLSFECEKLVGRLYIAIIGYRITTKSAFLSILGPFKLVLTLNRN